MAPGLLAAAVRDPGAEGRIDTRARRLVEAIRSRSGGLGGIEDFLHAYSLSTKEGLALMVLAEALLRVPDALTADRLIDMGPEGGEEGGYLIAAGTPEQVAGEPDSATGQFLARLVEAKPRKPRAARRSRLPAAA